jgi:hypothetical protein
MANMTDERLLDSFREASGSGMSGPHDMQSVAEEMAGAMRDALSTEMTPEAAGGTPATAQEQTKAMWDALTTEMTPKASGGTPAGAQGQADSNPYGESGTPAGSSYHSSSGTSSSGSSSTSTDSSTASKIESAASTYSEGGGLISLIPKLIGLFSGGPSTPPVLEKYAMPSSISFTSADTGSGLSASDFDQMGTPRLYSRAADSPDAASGGAAANSSVVGQGGGTSGSGGSATAPQISVTVQTMDARSFLDNSDQIAPAVRGAMLNLSSINDVVNEL